MKYKKNNAAKNDFINIIYLLTGNIYKVNYKNGDINI